MKEADPDPASPRQETTSGRRRSTREGKKKVIFSPTKEVRAPLPALYACGVGPAGSPRTSRPTPATDVLLRTPPLSRCGVHGTDLGKEGQAPFVRAPQTEQHGRRHRKTNQEVLDDLISARQEVKNAYMYVEVCEVMEDILYALSVSIGGTYECEMCMYENKATWSSSSCGKKIIRA